MRFMPWPRPPTSKLRDGIMTGTLGADHRQAPIWLLRLGRGLERGEACSKGCSASCGSSTWWHRTTAGGGARAITDATLLQHRAVAVADWRSAAVPPWACWAGRMCSRWTPCRPCRRSCAAWAEAFAGTHGAPLCEVYHLVARRVARPERSLRIHYAWAAPVSRRPGAAMVAESAAKHGHAPCPAENHHHF